MAVSEDVVAIVGGDGLLHVLDRDFGVMRWTASPSAESKVQGTPVIGDGSVFVVAGGMGFDPALSAGVLLATGDRTLVTAAYEEETGGLRWLRDFAADEEFGPAVYGYWALDAETGSLLWNHPESTYESVTQRIAEKGLFLTASAGLDDDLVAFEPSTGDRLWTVSSDGFMETDEPGDTDRYILRLRQQVLLAIDADSGLVRWSKPGNWSRWVIENETVFADTSVSGGGSPDSITALDMATGNELWRHSPGVAFLVPADSWSPPMAFSSQWSNRHW
jgi:outer membrane protein assembly factor BamB